MDISQAMVDLYNKKVFNQGISPKEMLAVHGDLVSDKEFVEIKDSKEEEWWNFDLVVVGVSLINSFQARQIAGNLMNLCSYRWLSIISITFSKAQIVLPSG